MPRRLLSIAVVARLQAVSTRTIQRQIAAGEYDEVVYVTPTDVRIPADAVRRQQDARTVRSGRRMAA
jgi:hypothetical protein